MIRYISILLLLICCCTSMQAQSDTAHVEGSEVSQYIAQLQDSPLLRGAALRPVANRPGSMLLARQPTSFQFQYEPKHYGFFCKIEDKGSPSRGLVPRFRLGSIEYVDALEGKTLSPDK